MHAMESNLNLQAMQHMIRLERAEQQARDCRWWHALEQQACRKFSLARTAQLEEAGCFEAHPVNRFTQSRRQSGVQASFLRNELTQALTQPTPSSNFTKCTSPLPNPTGGTAESAHSESDVLLRTELAAAQENLSQISKWQVCEKWREENEMSSTNTCYSVPQSSPMRPSCPSTHPGVTSTHPAQTTPTFGPAYADDCGGKIKASAARLPANLKP
eukprot:5594462-Amphidinium_carterae.1